MKLRRFAYKEGQMTPVWEIVRERECDPNPDKYSLRHSNGTLHSELRGFGNKHEAISAAKEEGYNVAQVGETRADLI